jgi:hypothetical protein
MICGICHEQIGPNHTHDEPTTMLDRHPELFLGAQQ